MLFYYNVKAETQNPMRLEPRESMCLGFGFNAFNSLHLFKLVIKITSTFEVFAG